MVLSLNHIRNLPKVTFSAKNKVLITYALIHPIVTKITQEQRATNVLSYKIHGAPLSRIDEVPTTQRSAGFRIYVLQTIIKNLFLGT